MTAGVAHDPGGRAVVSHAEPTNTRPTSMRAQPRSRRSIAAATTAATTPREEEGAWSRRGTP